MAPSSNPIYNITISLHLYYCYHQRQTQPIVSDTKYKNVKLTASGRSFKQTFWMINSQFSFEPISVLHLYKRILLIDYYIFKDDIAWQYFEPSSLACISCHDIMRQKSSRFSPKQWITIMLCINTAILTCNLCPRLRHSILVVYRRTCVVLLLRVWAEGGAGAHIHSADGLSDNI